MNSLFLHLIFAILSFTSCYNFPFRALRDIDSTCPIQSCVEKQIDVRSAFEDKINMTSFSNGIRIHFEKDLFSFSCSIFDMYRACMNDLTPEELALCIPAEEQQIVSRILTVIDNDVCSKDQRLDKLIPCMNEGIVQKLFFEDLVLGSYQFLDSRQRKGALPCYELKKKYIGTVAILSKSCDNDGLAALLEILNDLMTKLQDVISLGLMVVDKTPNDICLSALQEATVTAKGLLSY